MAFLVLGLVFLLPVSNKFVRMLGDALGSN